ncbi:MAG: bifunctional folylpolyglutamate synthase/dihydrofolate synthase [Synechococcales cyanobacterium M58_A2018_015]|nr:bifunctional folylpolyglutamate synthase/dihydrofolate synthase [Synechococcales cyanobacterium M58_A2018_015]
MNAADSADSLDSRLSPLTQNQALAAVEGILNGFTHFGVELGLERIERLLADLGNPHHAVPIVHVAGSNGKGSVCAYLSSILSEAGYRVGRYTSPHLVSWCERICLNQQPIEPLALYEVVQQVVAAIRPNYPSPTQFEVITAAAWLYFAQQQVDIAVIEVGLGGRLDATNVCDRPLVSVITSLSREHWQRLGPTLADISREKAGILKPNCPAVIAPQPADAAAVLEQRLQELDCPAIWVQPARDVGNGWAEWDGWQADPRSTLSSIPPLRYPVPLLGAHQLINSAVAMAAIQVLRQQGWPIEESHILQGMARTQWQGRLQWITWQNRPLLIDGAHNPAGAATLRHYLDAGINAGPMAQPGSKPLSTPPIYPPIYWVIGMIANKDHADVFQALLRPGDSLALVPVPDHLAVDLPNLANLAQQVCPQLAACGVFPDVLEALEAAMQATQAGAATVVLCGSLYLIGHFLARSTGQGVAPSTTV